MSSVELFSGRTAFNLKATHGLPLDAVFHTVIVEKNLMIDWPEFICAARENKRWDFQTVPDVEQSLSDAGVHRDTISEIIARMKLWILANPM